MPPLFLLKYNREKIEIMDCSIIIICFGLKYGILHLFTHARFWAPFCLLFLDRFILLFFGYLVIRFYFIYIHMKSLHTDKFWVAPKCFQKKERKTGIKHDAIDFICNAFFHTSLTSGVRNSPQSNSQIFKIQNSLKTC